MKIVAFDTQVSVMRKDDPTWKFALGASPIIEGHILRIATDDGLEGFAPSRALWTPSLST